MSNEQINKPYDPSKDYFPTSAKHIYLRLGMLLGFIVFACIAVYYGQ